MAAAGIGAFMATYGSAIAAGTAVASSVYAGVQARQQADAQEKYQDYQNKMALQSMRDQYAQISENEKSAREENLQEGIRNQEEYAKRKGRIDLMSAVSGTGGLSVDSMMQDLRRQKGRNMNTILRNQSIQLDQFQNQAEQVRVGAQSRIDNRKIQKPSWAEVGIGAATSGLQGYMNGQDLSAGLGNGGNPSGTMQTGGGYGSLKSSVNYQSSNSLYGGV